MKTTAVLVEDHVAYRESFRLALSSVSTSFEVVGEAGSAREAFAVIERTDPDSRGDRLSLARLEWDSLARELRRRRARTKILILGRIAHPLFVRDGLRAGVGGFALKHEPLADVIAAMTAVAEGERHLSGPLREEMDAALARKVPGLAELSAREREILFLLVEGFSSKEIAKSLFLSSKTVDAHRLHINRKLGVRSPAGLARLVADEGLIPA